MILNKSNKQEARAYFRKILDLGIDFKLQDNVTRKQLSVEAGKKLITSLPDEGSSPDAVLDEFCQAPQFLDNNSTRM